MIARPLKIEITPAAARFIDGENLAGISVLDDPFKPYLHPLRTPDGHVVTVPGRPTTGTTRASCMACVVKSAPWLRMVRVPLRIRPPLNRALCTRRTRCRRR